MKVLCPVCTHKFDIDSPIIFSKRTLLVEGPDDLLFIQSFKKKHALNIPELTVDGKNGFSGIENSLKNINANTGFNSIEKLFIIADADQKGIQKQFKRLTRLLDPKYFSIPTSLGNISTYIVGKKQAAIYLMPNNKKNGILEDLLVHALVKPKKLPTIKRHITAIKKKKLLTLPDYEINKGIFHIYMATTETPTGTVGGAIMKGHVDLTAPLFNKLKDFLNQLL